MQVAVEIGKSQGPVVVYTDKSGFAATVRYICTLGNILLVISVMGCNIKMVCVFE